MASILSIHLVVLIARFAESVEALSTVRWRKSKRNKTEPEVADLIERFLEGRSLYPQEWNDFVDSSQRSEKVESYRKRCYELDAIVNRPGAPDAEAVAELKEMIRSLRSGATSRS